MTRTWKNQIGLKRGMVSVVAYQPVWKDEFAAERQRLAESIGNYISDIEHIGSTSVPGLAAKPIIDMIAAVDDLSVYEQLIVPLTALGYEYMPERVFRDRVFFPKGPRENRTHHLSLVVKDTNGWTEPIIFREYLVRNDSARSRYQELKLSLAKKYPHDRAAYTKTKEQLVKQILHEAHEMRIKPSNF